MLATATIRALPPMRDGAANGSSHELWQSCVDHLAQELPEQQFNTWIRPLVAEVADDLSKVTIQVANRFKLDWIRAQYAGRISALLEKFLATAFNLS